MAARQCNGCTLCCKVMAIDELEKPVNIWCKHCDIGVGCKIYETKPPSCTGFQCGYLANPQLGEEWYPAKSRMVLITDSDGSRIAVTVDPGLPHEWKKEPYYGQLKHWSRVAAEHGGQVAIKNGEKMIIVLPEEDVDLGVVAQDQVIVTSEIETPFGPKLHAFAVHKDDSRVKGRKLGEWTKGPRM